MDATTTTDVDEVRVLVADDQPVVREGFSMLLDAVHGFTVVGCPLDCDELLVMASNREADVVLLDMCLDSGDGEEFTQSIKRRHPGVAILLFLHGIAEEPLERALASGVNGVILKDAPVTEVLEAIRAVAGGAHVLGRDLVAPSEGSQFSPREREVLRLLADGLNNRQISRALFISLSTTKTHLENIARKLGTTHRAAAVAEAIRRGLVA